MRVRHIVRIALVWIAPVWIVLLASAAWAQLPQTSPVQSSTDSPVVPRLVRFSGVIKDGAGRPRTGVSGITFALYRSEQAGAPLWIETQSAQLDSRGNYSVMLGSTNSDGLPADLFTSGEARWLGVQPEGQAEQPRILLLSVPYALKAGDAATLGGLPPSAFLLAAPAASTSVVTDSGATPSSPAPGNAPASSNVTTTGGTVNTLPLFTTSTNIQNSALSQTGSGSSAKIGIGTTAPSATLDVKGAATIEGTLTAPATGTASSSGGKSSQVHNFVASAYNSGTASAVNQTFQWKAEAASNNTSTPSGTLNLLFGSGTSSPTETGLKLSSKGLFTFATGQTFPGAGTITGVTTASGSGLTGGGTTGTLSIGLLKTCSTNQTLQWNGSSWVCATASGSGTVTSVGLSAPSSDFTVSGSPVTTSGTLSFNWTAAPTSNDTANTIVKRDGSGNFAANTITAGSVGGGSVNTTTGNITTLTAGTLTATSASLSSSLSVSTSNGIAIQASSSSGGATTISAAATATSGAAWGIEGSTASSFSDAYGVYGLASSATGTPLGVYGKAISPTGFGVFGQNGDTESSTGLAFLGFVGSGTWGDGGTTRGDYGALGTADDGPGGVFENSSSGYYTLYAQNNDALGYPLLAYNAANGSYCIVDYNGDLSCSGTKNAVIPIDGGKRKVAMSAIESPKNWFEDAGAAELVNGSAVVALDPDFIQTVNTEREYMVFPVPNGDCKGLYVSHQTATSFEVHELGGGSSSVRFYYRIMALRKNYEDVRFADHTNDPDPRKMIRHGQPANLKTNPRSSKSAFPIASKSFFNPASGLAPRAPAQR